MADYDRYSHLNRSSGISYQDPPGHWPQASSQSHDHSYSSHYSHAAPSTRSWVQSNQAHPPPPPPEDLIIEDSRSPAVIPRPLPPRPTSVNPGMYYTPNAQPIEEENEEELEYMNIDPDVSGQYEFPPLPPQQHRFNFFPGPTSRFSPDPIPVLVSTPSPPAEKKKSFVGGFVKNIKRLPGRLRYGGKNEKGRPFGRGTFGNDNGEGPSGQGRGNTLPEYRSNPGSPNPVEYVPNVQMAFSPSMLHAVPNVVRSPASEGTDLTEVPRDRNIPPSLLAGGTQMRPLTPSFHLTPPSDENNSHESHHESYQSHHSGYTQIQQSVQPQYVQVIHPDPVMSPNNAERTTVMVYSDSAADTHGVPLSDPGLQRVPSRTNRASAGPTRQSTITIHDPLRRSNPPLPPPIGAQTSLSRDPPSQDPRGVLEEETVTSPATERLAPTADYRKMSSFRSPSRGTLWTKSTATSLYDPSFASQKLTPVEKFFKSLYHLPWVSHGRLTVDYRPGGEKERAKYKRVFKKQMPSWYRRLSRSGKSANVDLLSSGSMSIPDITGRTSVGMSMSSIPESPRSGRSGRSGRRHTTGSDGRQNKSGGQSSGHRRHRHRHHHRRRRSMSLLEDPSGRPTDSPMLPAAYPYPYPAYPFTYPGYAAMPPGMPGTPGVIPMMPSTPPATPGSAQHHIPVQVVAAPIPMAMHAPQPQSRHQHRSSPSKKAPRGPRTRSSSTRLQTYPGGYAAYQTMAYPPPIYVQGSPPAPVAASTPIGVTPPQQQQPQLIQYVPVPMHVVPGAYNPGVDYYQTASSIPSPPSSPTPRGTSAAHHPVS